METQQEWGILAAIRSEEDDHKDEKGGTVWIPGCEACGAHTSAYLSTSTDLSLRESLLLVAQQHDEQLCAQGDQPHFVQNVLANYDRAYNRASLKYGGHMRDAKVQAILGLYGDPFRTSSNTTAQTITTQEDTDDEDYYECANASEMGFLTL